MSYKDLFVSDELPDPLNKEEALEYLKRTRNGDSAAREKVITHNIKLVLKRVSKKFLNVDYEKKELVSIGIVGLINAVDTFDVTKEIEFSTYASKCIDNEIFMFLRRLKIQKQEQSIQDSIGTDKDGKELRVEETIADENSDFVTESLNKELLREVRKEFEKLVGRDREIIKLYFGFDSDRRFRQREIGKMLGISRSYVSRIITSVVIDVKNNLIERSLIEGVSSKNNREVENLEESEKLKRQPKSIYKYFEQYTKEQITEMLTKLSPEDRQLITLRYGEDLEHPKTSELWQSKYNPKFYRILVPKMKRILLEMNVEKNNIPENKTEENKKQKRRDSLQAVIGQNNETQEAHKEKDEKALELFSMPIFTKMLGLLSAEEKVIISLRLGYIKGKKFSSREISEFLEISEVEIIEITKRVLLLYRENIIRFVDATIEILDNEPDDFTFKKTCGFSKLQNS